MGEGDGGFQVSKVDSSIFLNVHRYCRLCHSSVEDAECLLFAGDCVSWLSFPEIENQLCQTL